MNRSDFLNNAKETIQALEKQIDELMLRAKDSPQADQSGMKYQISALKEKQAELQSRYKKAEQASEADFAQARQAFNDAANDLNDTFHDKRSQLEE